MINMTYTVQYDGVVLSDEFMACLHKKVKTFFSSYKKFFPLLSVITCILST